MPKNSRELEILNQRRIALQENLEAFAYERNRLKRRLNIMTDHIDAAENEIAAIDTQLKSLVNKENFEVKLHIVHGEHDTNNPKLMIEIILENHPPIFKLLSQYDLAIYSDRDNPTDKMLLKSRLIEVVEEWLSNDRSISRLFSDSDEKLDDALENYVNDSAFERKIRKAAAFFPIMLND
jgi:chromosome segregation ATPase